MRRTESLRTSVRLLGILVALGGVPSAADAASAAKLVDVFPDGRALKMTDYIARMRYREGLSKEVFMNAGEVYELRFPLNPTSTYLPPGHRLRVEVSSSAFPTFDRNLNTGANNETTAAIVKATNTLYHSARYPSHVVLPVMP